MTSGHSCRVHGNGCTSCSAADQPIGYGADGAGGPAGILQAPAGMAAAGTGSGVGPSCSTSCYLPSAAVGMVSKQFVNPSESIICIQLITRICTCVCTRACTHDNRGTGCFDTHALTSIQCCCVFPSNAVHVLSIVVYVCAYATCCPLGLCVHGHRAREEEVVCCACA